MLAGINIVCFAASYFVAWLLEVSRLFFRSGLRGAVMLGFGAAGLLAHTLFLVNRALRTDVPPLSSAYDWYLVAAWLLAATYLYLTSYHPRSAIGLFVLPLVLLLIGAGAFLADAQPFATSQATRLWGMLHGLSLSAGTVAVTVGFVAGIMYLVQAWELKHKLLPLRGLQLPSLEWLERVNSRAIVYSVLLLTVGVLSGVVLNLINRSKSAESLPWTDPIVVSSAFTVLWLLVAFVFSWLYRPARQGHKVAYLTVASFVFLVITLGVSLVVPSQHRPGTQEVHFSPQGRPLIDLSDAPLIRKGAAA